MTKRHPKKDDGKELSCDLWALYSAANTLIKEQCSAEAVAQALHPVTWIKNRVKQMTRDFFKPVLPNKESPRLLAAAKHLVAVAKRYCPKVKWTEPWFYNEMVKKRGTDYADREIMRRDEVFDPMIARVDRYCKKRQRAHASEAESLAINVFLEVLKGMRASYHPKPKPTEVVIVEAPHNHCPSCSSDNYANR